MITETATEIREKLKSFAPENMAEKLGLLKKLLEHHYHAQFAVDIERARYITAYYKQTEYKREPAALRRAKAIKYYLVNRATRFFDDNLLGGSTTAKEIGAPLYPEFYLGLSIWPELNTISTRSANPQLLSKEEARELNLEIFPYWLERSISERVRKIDPIHQSLLEKAILFIVSKPGAISHTTPCYEIVLKRGLVSLIHEAEAKEELHRRDKQKREFYRTVQVALEGVLAYAHHLSEKARELAAVTTNPFSKQNLETIAVVLRHVPALPARSYREAVNALWLCQVAVLAENANMAINPGRLDQILYPYFKADYESGRLSLEEALTITGCLWLKLADNVNLVPESAERLFGGAGTVPAITLGGVDREGRDAVNDLTYLMLKVVELIPIRDPNVNARFYPGVNSVEYRDEVARVILQTKAIPALYNDAKNIETLQHQGLSLEHARDYAIIGCVELGSAGRDYCASSSVFIMLYTILHMALHNGCTPVTGTKSLGPETGEARDFKTFADFWQAYQLQTRWMADMTTAFNNLYGKEHQRFLQTPLLSALFEGPLEKGRDLIFGGALYNSSGVTHIGFADVCDSLCAIEDICFNPYNPDIQLSLPEFVKAVDENFKGYEQLHAYLLNKAPKFGTGHPLAQKHAAALLKLEYDVFNYQHNYRHGNYRVAYWTMTNHAGYGKVSNALPSGRKAGVPFSSGLTPVSQVKTDLTTVLNDVAKLEKKYIPGCYALNIKFAPLAVNKENITRFGSMIEAYMRNGGQQVQFNIHDYQTLQDAKLHPEQYPRLLVRVSGYSAYFKSLNEAMKDELITRSQYNLETGRLVPLASLTASLSASLSSQIDRKMTSD